MNYMYNATDRKMSKFVDNNRENNEGYYSRVPEHTNNLFVQENSKKMLIFRLNSFAKTDLGRKPAQVELYCYEGDTEYSSSKNSGFQHSSEHRILQLINLSFTLFVFLVFPLSFWVKNADGKTE